MVTCPNCGSENVIIEEKSGIKGYGFCLGILGFLCLGPIGFLCGFMGFGKPKYHRTYIKCNNCGMRSSVSY